MGEAFLWGAFGASSLLIGAVVAYVASPSKRFLAVVMALGAGLLIGSILDGIPESFVLGLTVLEGGVSVGLLTGVMLSNLPEGMSSSAGLRTAGWPRHGRRHDAPRGLRGREGFHRLIGRRWLRDLADPLDPVSPRCN